MKTLVLGQYGRMGRRYSAILSHLGVDYDGWDVTEVGESHTPNIGRLCPSLHNFARVIICTPTEHHIDNIYQCLQAGVKWILCEKPVAMSLEKVQDLITKVHRSDLRVVCNWAYVFDKRTLGVRSHDVWYRNWYSGQHSIDWNCIQLHYLSRDWADLGVGPRFQTRIDGEQVTLGDIDDSYIRMLQQWYRDPEGLWGTADILEQTRLIASHPA